MSSSNKGNNKTNSISGSPWPRVVNQQHPSVVPEMPKVPPSTSSRVLTSRTAGAVVGDFKMRGLAEAPLFPSEEPPENFLPIQEPTGQQLELVETDVHAETATSVGEKYDAWLLGDPVVRQYQEQLTGPWEEMVFNGRWTDDYPEQWQNGNPIFDMEAVAGQVGVSFNLGLFFKRMFWQPDKRLFETVLFFPAEKGQDWANDGVVGSALDEILDVPSQAFGIIAFCASLSLKPRRPVPANRSLILRISIRDSQQSKGNTKITVEGTVVDPEDGLVYVDSDALFILPERGGMDLRMFEVYHNATDLQGIFDNANRLTSSWLADKPRPGRLEEARARREASISKLRTPDGSSVFFRHPERENIETEWLAEDPAVQHYDQALSLFSPPGLAGYCKYWNGKALLRWYRAEEESASTWRSFTDGEALLVGLVQFLDTAEGPPRTAEGGCAYALLDCAVQHAVMAVTGSWVQEELRKVPNITLKVNMRRKTPLHETLVVECRLGARTAEGHRSILATLKSHKDPSILYVDGEAPFPGSLAPPRSSL